jgi:hypothetical protein
VVREPYELVCNFSGDRARVPCEGRDVVVATGDDAQVTGEGIELGPLSGALVAP